MKIPQIGETLYLLWWEGNNPIPIVKPMEICNVVKLSNGGYSYEIYFKSSYNISRSITQLGLTMFGTKDDADSKLKEYCKEIV